MKSKVIFAVIFLGLVACSNVATPAFEETEQATHTPAVIITSTATASPWPPTATLLPTMSFNDPDLAGLVYYRQSAGERNFWQINDVGERVPHYDAFNNRPSPNRRYFATHCGEDCNDIFLTDLTSNEEVNLTNTLDKYSHNPVWSTDSKAIYYLETDGERSDIWRIDIKTLEKTHLSQMPNDENNLLYGRPGYPRHLFYLSYDWIDGEGLLAQWEIINLDDLEDRVRFENLAEFPIFSHDFKMVGLVSHEYDEAGDSYRQGWLLRIGSEPEPFPQENYQIGNVTDIEIITRFYWSPDNSKVAWWTEGKRGDKDFFGVVIQEVDSSNESTIISESLPLPHPTNFAIEWSPDSRWIAYVAYDPEHRAGIWLADSNGQTNQFITGIGDHLCSRIWSPDAKRVFFSCTFYHGLLEIDTMEQYETEHIGYPYLWSTIVEFEVNKSLRVTYDGADLPLQAEPSFEAPALLQFQVGDVIEVIDGPVEAENFIWWEVRTEDGITGWVVEQQLIFEPAELP